MLTVKNNGLNVGMFWTGIEGGGTLTKVADSAILSATCLYDLLFENAYFFNMHEKRFRSATLPRRLVNTFVFVA